MLSYRHGFHAGNHADVLKHIVLVDCIRRLVVKESPLLYVDTHAGAGSYELREGYAAMNEEWAGGIDKLSALTGPDAPGPETPGPETPGPDAPGPDAPGREAPPAAVARYLSLVRGYGTAYPGSPALAASMLRPQDRLALFELHPSDSGPLTALFAGDGRVRVMNADGFSGLRGLLPPPSRRGLVLIDPSYELAADYDRVVETVAMAVRRFATGVYAIWYPLLERDEARRLPGRLAGLAEKTLDVRLRTRASLPGERGMSGSGMVVLNPPWMLREAMDEALPWLSRALGEDEGAGWGLEYKERGSVEYGSQV